MAVPLRLSGRARRALASLGAPLLLGAAALLPLQVVAQDSTLVPPDQPPALQAQPQDRGRRGENCEAVGYRVLNSVQFGGSRLTQMGLPEFVCADGIRVRADSAVDYEAAGRIEFIGGFRYEDADRVLTSVDADYFEPQSRLFARGNVTVLARDGTDLARDVERGQTAPFDAAVARGFGPPDSTLATAARLLGRGGIIVISEPPGGHPWEVLLSQHTLAVTRESSPIGVATFRVG